MTVDAANSWDGVRQYREWLLAEYPYWGKVLKPGETKIRQVASNECLALPKAFEAYFGILNGQKTEKQYPIPFQSTFGFVLLDIERMALRRNNELGYNLLVRNTPYEFSYHCEEGARSGLWRKGWYPLAETHVDYGNHLIFADFDPPGESGRVILQTQWLGFTSGWCQRLVLAESLGEFFGGLAALGRRGVLAYRKSFGIDVVDRGDTVASSLLGLDRVMRMPPEAECKG